MPRRAPSVRSSTSTNDRVEPKLLKAVEANDIVLVGEALNEAKVLHQHTDNLLGIGLNRACDRNNVHIARFLLLKGANPDYASGNKQCSLLRAAERGHEELIKVLVEYGADLEASDKKGRTALMTAAWKGHVSVVMLLLSSGALIDSRDGRLRNVLHNLAADRGDCRGHDSGRKFGRDVVEYILQHGIDVDAEDELGRTALHWTAVTNNEDLMRLLLHDRFSGAAPKADVNATDSRMKTALHFAAAHDKAQLVRILLDNGADVTARSDGGWTPLHNACTQASQETLDALLLANADVNSELLNGRTPLHVAAESGNVVAVRLLLAQRGVKRNVKDRFSNSPLLMAVPKDKDSASVQTNKKAILEMLAPWNHTHSLSPYEIEASQKFEATIVDFGNFRNENKVTKRSVYDLLYARDPRDVTKHAISTLPESLKAVNFRWIHLCSNNISWCEALLTKRFIEEGAHDIEGYKALQTSFNHQHRGQKPHSRFMRPMVQVIPRAAPEVPAEIKRIEKTEAPKTVVEEPSTMASSIELPAKPRQSPGTPTHTSTDTSSLRASQTVVGGEQQQNKSSANGTDPESSGKKKAGKFPKSPKPPSRQHSRDLSSFSKKTGGSLCNISMFMPYLHFETDMRRREMQNAIDCAFQHRSRKELSQDEILIQAHVTASTSFLHVRRTLDQFFYHNIDTHLRDCDQVVYRYQKKQREDSEGPTIYMVDQLWLWVLGKDLVVTSFPQRWRQPRNDPLNVLEGIIEDINSKTREPIQNVYELAMTITGRCYGAFDRHRKGDEDFQFLDMFEASIGSVMDAEASLFQNFLTASRQASEWLRDQQSPPQFSTNLEAAEQTHRIKDATHDLFHNEEDVPEREPLFVDNLLDVGAETDLLAEIKDIRDELDILRMVLDHQDHLSHEFKHTIKSIYADERSKSQLGKLDKVFEDQEKTIVNPLKDIKRMDNQAARIYESIRDLLDLKQKHANAFEARFARDQAAGTVRQGRTILVFTVATVVFLPLSFMASFFSISVTEFPHQNGGQEMPLAYVSAYIFGIGFALAIPCIIIALTVDEAGWMLISLRKKIREAWWKSRSKRGEPEAVIQLQSLVIERKLAEAKATRRSLDPPLNGHTVGHPRKSADVHGENMRGRQPAANHHDAWDVERGLRISRD